MKKENKTTMVGARLTENERRQLERIAEKEKRSISDIVRLMILKLLKRGEL